MTSLDPLRSLLQTLQSVHYFFHFFRLEFMFRLLHDLCETCEQEVQAEHQDRTVSAPFVFVKLGENLLLLLLLWVLIDTQMTTIHHTVTHTHTHTHRAAAAAVNGREEGCKTFPMDMDSTTKKEEMGAVDAQFSKCPESQDAAKNKIKRRGRRNKKRKKGVRFPPILHFFLSYANMYNTASFK